MKFHLMMSYFQFCVCVCVCGWFRYKFHMFHVCRIVWTNIYDSVLDQKGRISWVINMCTYKQLKHVSSLLCHFYVTTFIA